MSRVVEVSRDELLAQRAALLARARVSYEELRERAEVDDLRGDEWLLWENITSVDFLLGNDVAPRGR